LAGVSDASLRRFGVSDKPLSLLGRCDEPFSAPLPRDEDTPSPGPSLSIGQLLIAAHKEVNRLEQAGKAAPPLLDATPEFIAEEKVEW
jgi:hypothetical protein